MYEQKYTSGHFPQGKSALHATFALPKKEWNAFVAVWVAFVSILKLLFNILPVKTAFLKYRSLFN